MNLPTIYSLKNIKNYVQSTDWIYDLIDAYGKVYPNLKKHANNYPTTAHLKSLVSIGNIDFEGEMEKDTDGSDFIRKKLLDTRHQTIKNNYFQNTIIF